MFNDYYRGKRLFVTGHTGFKGGWLSLWLRRLGAEVWGYSLAPESEPNFHALLGKTVFERETAGDLRDLEALKTALAECKPDVVFHLAAQPLVRRSYRNPVETLEVNVLGTAHVLEAVREIGRACNVVIVTSDKCYENPETGHPCREGDKLGGHDVYSASKAAAEIMAASWGLSFFAPDSALGKVATARAGNVLGGGDYGEDRILPDCVRALQKGEPIMVRNPAATRPWQHVLESVSGYLTLGEYLARTGDEAPRDVESFNFGPGPENNRPVSELVEAVLKQWPGLWKQPEPSAQPYEATLLNLSIEKAAAELRWRPAWDFAETVEKAMEWYCARHRERAGDEAMLALSGAQIEAYAERVRQRDAF